MREVGSPHPRSLHRVLPEFQRRSLRPLLRKPFDWRTGETRNALMNHNRGRPIERLHRWPRGDPSRRAAWEGGGNSPDPAKNRSCKVERVRSALRPIRFAESLPRERRNRNGEKEQEKGKGGEGRGGEGRRASKFRDGLKPRCGQALTRSIHRRLLDKSKNGTHFQATEGKQPSTDDQPPFAADG